MEDLIAWLKENYLLVISTVICLIAIFLSAFCLYYTNKEFKDFNAKQQQNLKQTDTLAVATTEEEKPTNKFLIDIKGAVKNPGVYECDNTCIVNDVINLAGGLTKNATTEDINLSKKVTNEMVIMISTKNELKKATTKTNNTLTNDAALNVSSSNDNSSSTPTSSLVNINTADVNTLMTLNGIGSSKAQSIIDYRNTNGPFKTIEDILNVSGIGESVFAKIKDYITI